MWIGRVFFSAVGIPEDTQLTRGLQVGPLHVLDVPHAVLAQVHQKFLLIHALFPQQRFVQRAVLDEQGRRALDHHGDVPVFPADALDRVLENGHDGQYEHAVQQRHLGVEHGIAGCRSESDHDDVLQGRHLAHATLADESRHKKGIQIHDARTHDDFPQIQQGLITQEHAMKIEGLYGFHEGGGIP